MLQIHYVFKWTIEESSYIDQTQDMGKEGRTVEYNGLLVQWDDESGGNKKKGRSNARLDGTPTSKLLIMETTGAN